MGSVQPLTMQRDGSCQVQDFVFDLFAFCGLCLPSLSPSEHLSCSSLHQSCFIHGSGEDTKQKSSEDRPLRKSIWSEISRRHHYSLPHDPGRFFLNLIRHWPRKWGFHPGYHGRWCKNGLVEAKIDIINNCSLISHTSIHFIVDGKQFCKS